MNESDTDKYMGFYNIKGCDWLSIVPKYIGDLKISKIDKTFLKWRHSTWGMLILVTVWLGIAGLLFILKTYVETFLVLIMGMTGMVLLLAYSDYLEQNLEEQLDTLSRILGDLGNFLPIKKPHSLKEGDVIEIELKVSKVEVNK